MKHITRHDPFPKIQGEMEVGRCEIHLEKKKKKVKIKEVYYSEWYNLNFDTSRKIFAQPAFTCLKLTTETLEQGVKYVQS